MSYRVTVTPIARAEAMETFRWYAARSDSAATRWYAGLNRAIGQLAENPGRHPLSEDDSEAFGREVRLKLYGRRRGVYRILFVITGDEVSVIRIRHSARGPIEPLDAGE